MKTAGDSATKGNLRVKDNIFKNCNCSTFSSYHPLKAYVSVRRVTKFLMNTELDPTAVSHEDTPGVAAVVENGTLAWAPDAEPALLKYVPLSRLLYTRRSS